MRYCAFLRGVNVNGTSMKMMDVVEVFKNVGLDDVCSVLATGNILFSSENKIQDLKKVLETELGKRFHYDCFLFIKTKKEVDEIVENSPFSKNVDFHTYCCITEAGKASILMEECSKLTLSEGEEVQCINDIIYWKVKKGSTLDSDFGKLLGVKKFKNLFTSRNINTLEKISKK